MSETDLSIVIVSCNVRNDLLVCLKSIYEDTDPGLSFEILVVDNDSGDGSVEAVRKEYPGVTVIENRNNLGFPAANNQAFRIARGRYVAMLNPDTEVVGNALARLKKYLDDHPDVSIVGPRLVYFDDAPQRSVWRFPKVRYIAAELLYLTALIPGKFYADKDLNRTIEVESMSGAAMMFPRKLLDQVGMLDENLFWIEDVDFCYRIRKADGKVVYLPEVKIRHHIGRSARENYEVSISNQILSKIKYFQVHHHSSQVRVIMLITMADAVVRFVILAGLSPFGIIFRKKALAYMHTIPRIIKPVRTTDAAAQTSPWSFLGLRPSPFLKDLTITTATSLMVGIGSVLVTRFIALEAGPSNLGIFSLAKQTLTILAPFSTLMMSGTIMRYVAMARDDRATNRVLVNGIMLCIAPAMMIWAVGSLFSGALGRIIFHEAAHANIASATVFVAAGTSVFTVLYAYLLGSGQVAKANLAQLTFAAVGPLTIASIYAKTGRMDLLLRMNGLMYCLAMIPLALIVWKRLAAVRGSHTIGRAYKVMLAYSLPRIPGGFAHAGIMATGPFLASHFLTFRHAGYLAAAQAVFAFVETAVSSFGIVALPQVARLLTRGQVQHLQERIRDVIELTVAMGIFGSLHVGLWADNIIMAWLGPEYGQVIPLFRILLVTLMPYLAYVMLRMIIDGIEVRPVNTKNLYISLLVTIASALALSYMGYGAAGLAVSTSAGFTVLGFLTIGYLWRTGWVERSAITIGNVLILNIGLLLVALAAKKLIVTSFGPIPALGIGFALELSLLTLYYLIMRRLKTRWILQIEQRIFSGD